MSPSFQMGTNSEKCVVRLFHGCVTITQHTYKKVDYSVPWIWYRDGSWLQTCIACYCAEYCGQLSTAHLCT